jgi:glycosyltransferase involved in cell wall biosynthesis
MVQPLVSIFVQIYKTEPFIERCLDSVLSLAGDYPYEVLAIDDASPDRTWDIVQRYRDPRLKVVRHDKNAGANATANEGYAWGTGRYIARLDSDDVYRPNFLRELVPLLEQNPRVGLAYGDIALLDAHDRVTSPRGNVARGGRPAIGDEFFALCERNFVPAPATLLRREALAPLLPVPRDYSFLDWYVSTGVAERWSTAYVDTVVAEYRVQPTGAHRTMIRDRTGEDISFSVLDRLWSNGSRMQEKAAQRGRVYGANYLVYGEKYFGQRNYLDARRCYLAAGRLAPQLLLDPGVLRRLCATFVSPRVYEGAKGLLKGRGAA